MPTANLPNLEELAVKSIQSARDPLKIADRTRETLESVWLQNRHRPSKSGPTVPSQLVLVLGALALPFLSGCPQLPTGIQSSHTSPLEVAGAIVFHNAPAKRLDIVTASGSQLSISHPKYSNTPELRHVTANGKLALLLDTDGRSLAIVDGKTVREIALPSEFAGINDSEDSSAAVLWHPPSGGVTTSIVNTDEIALVDLGPAAGTTAVRVANLAGLGKAPLVAKATKELAGADGNHRLVWVEAAGRLGLIDFAPAGKVRTRVVPLAADTQSAIAPIRSEVRTSATAVELYLLAATLNDLVHVHIDLAGAELSATVDQVAAGAVPLDFHLFDSKEGLRVLTANFAGKSLALLDPANGSGLEIPLETAVTRFLPVQGADGRPRLLAWNHLQGSARAYTIDVDDLIKKKGKAITKLTFNAAIGAIRTVASYAVVQLQSSSASLALLEVVSGKVTEFQGAGALIDLRVVVSTGSTALWLLGTANSSSRLSRVDLVTLHAESLSLAATNPAMLVRLGDAGVAALGSGLGGFYVAAFPTGELNASKGQWLDGFALEGYTQWGAQ